MLHPKRIYLSMSVRPTYNYKLLIAYSATFVLDGVIIEYITRYDSSPGFHIFTSYSIDFSSCSILNWYKLADAVFLDHLSQVLRKTELDVYTFYLQDIKRTNSSAVWRYLIGTNTIWTKCSTLFRLQEFVTSYREPWNCSCLWNQVFISMPSSITTKVFSGIMAKETSRRTTTSSSSSMTHLALNIWTSPKTLLST